MTAGATDLGPSSTAGLAPSRVLLSTGVRILVKPVTTTPAVTILIALDAGSVRDPADLPGLAHFVSRTIDRGTESRTAEQIAEDLDGWGVSLQTSVSRHTLTLGCTCLAQDFERVLTLLADVTRHPSFPESEVETRRGHIQTLIRQEEDSPAAVATDTLLAVLYGAAHPYGRPLYGRAETVARIDRTALAAFHAAAVTPGGTCVAIVGDVNPAWATAAAERVFGSWTNRGTAMAAAASPAPLAARQVQVVPMMGKSQTDVAYGLLGIARSDPDYYAWWLMNTVLGEFALGGRLGNNIRERQGMAYYVSSTLGAGPIAGPLIVRAGVSGENVTRTVTAIDAELQRMATDGPTEQEFTESRQYLVGSMPLQLETNLGIAEYLQGVEFFGLGLDYDVRLPGLLQQVTRNDVHAAARRALDPSRAAIVVAGPFDGQLS
jgi:zinc protease